MARLDAKQQKQWNWMLETLQNLVIRVADLEREISNLKGQIEVVQDRIEE